MEQLNDNHKYIIQDDLFNDLNNIFESEEVLISDNKIVTGKELRNFRKHKEKTYYFISLINTTKSRNFLKYSGEKCFVHLMSRQYERILGKRYYPTILSFLTHNGFIERNHAYCKDKNSKSFRIAAKYRTSTCTAISATSSIITNNIAKNIEKKTEDLLTSNSAKEYTFLRNCLLNQEIDVEGATSWIDEAHKNNIPLNDKVIKSKNGYHFVKRNRTFDFSSNTTYLAAVNSVVEGNINFKIDDKTSRIFSNITNLPSQLRQFIKYNNKNLEYLDISSSQPLFLYKILSAYTKDNKGLRAELKVYKEQLEAGNFYEYIQDHCLFTNGIKADRDEIKTKMFSDYLYCKNSTETKFTKSLTKLFPQITKVIREIKKNDYTKLSLLLSKMESGCMINQVVKRIEAEVEGAYVLSIHDGLLVNEESRDEIMNIMLEEIEKNVGVVPSIKHEKYGESEKPREGVQVNECPFKPNESGILCTAVDQGFSKKTTVSGYIGSRDNSCEKEWPKIETTMNKLEPKLSVPLFSQKKYLDLVQQLEPDDIIELTEFGRTVQTISAKLFIKNNEEMVALPF